jgi:SAM-dependent methyltransferase
MVAPRLPVGPLPAYTQADQFVRFQIMTDLVKDYQDSAIIAALEDFSGAAPEDAPSAFQVLVSTVWDQGALTSEAAAALSAFIEGLEAGNSRVQGDLAILLGMIVEARNVTADIVETVHQGLDLYLELLASAENDSGLTLALLYLLGHFPADRKRILAVADGRDLDPDDLTRLDRCLTSYDQDDSAMTMRLGRAYPSPASWALTDAELRANDLVRLGLVSPERGAIAAAGETRLLLAYSGAKALWTIEHGEVAGTPPFAGAAEPSSSLAGVDEAALLERHIGVMQCTKCRDALRQEKGRVSCAGCGSEYLIADGYLDMLSEPDKPEDPLYASAHERWLRPAFMRMVGGNWSGEVTFADENRLIVEQVRPAAGAILDLGPGAGITTRTLGDVFGVDRLIAVDMSGPMLRRLKRRAPGALAIRADAKSLPFKDGTLGGVNAWNMLQYFTNKLELLEEVSRCLQPGGSLTIMSFRPAPDSVSRYFQGKIGEVATRALSDPDEIRELLTQAGMTVQELILPGGNFIVARAAR